MLRIRGDGPDGGLFTGNVHQILLLRHHHAAQLQPVVEGHEPAAEAQDDGEGAGHQQTGKHGAQIGQDLPLFGRTAGDGAPEGGGRDRGSLGQAQLLTPQQIVQHIGEDLRIGLERALVTEHLDEAAVGVVRGDLAVVDHGVVQQGEGMGAAPPARGVGGIAAVGRPGVGLILLQAVEPAHVLGVPGGLENPHVLPAREDIAALQGHVDLQNAPGHEGVLVHLHIPEGGLKGGGKVPPDQRLVGDLRNLSHGNLLRPHQVEPLLQKGLAGLPAAVVVKKDMDGEVVARELRNVRDLAQRFEISGTPFLIIGEKAFPGAIPADQIESALDEAE